MATRRLWSPRAAYEAPRMLRMRSLALTGLRRQATAAGLGPLKPKAPQWAWGLAAFSALAVAGSAGLFFGSRRRDGIIRQSLANSNEKLDQAYYQKVYDAIAESLEGEGAEEYDDGSFGPVLVRLAWHCSGTYDKHTHNGGSNGATMRFSPESNHGANAGLLHARNRLEPIKQKFPQISYSDLWVLAGICSVQEMGGPKIPFRPGRQDGFVEGCTPDGRLPDGDKGAPHIRQIFNRMGFDDAEITALSGAHALGRCHPSRSGFDGPWTHSPITFSNEYYKLLLDEKWKKRDWSGPFQYQDVKTKSLMMLPTCVNFYKLRFAPVKMLHRDMALVQDKSFRKHVERYAQSQEQFFEDFSKAFSKLLELGVPATNFEHQEPLTFKTTGE